MICENRQRLPLVVDVDKWPGTLCVGKLMSTLKRESEMKLTSILIILLFAFTLAACGGGGGSSRVPDVDMMPEPEEVTPSVDLMNLAVPVGDYMIAAGETMNVGEGETEVTLSCSAAAACAFTVPADGMPTATTGEVTAALSAAAMQAIADREEAHRLAMEEAAAAAVRDEAERIAAAIGPDEPNSEVQMRPMLATNQYLSIDGGKADVFAAAAIAADDKATPRASDNFSKSSSSPIDIRRWDEGAYERTIKEVTDTVVIYTNKEDDSSLNFLEYYKHEGPGTADTGYMYVPFDETVIDPDYVPAAADGTTDSTGTAGMLSFTFTDDAVPAGISGRFSANAFPQGKTDFEEYEGNNREFTGSFHGAPGTYKCTGTTCRAETNEKGVLSLLQGTWTFQANTKEVTDGDITTTVVEHDIEGLVKDADYLDFGYWLSMDTSGDEPEYTFTSVVQGKSPLGHDDIEEVKGSYDYEGPATGIYMKKSIDDDNVATPLSSGQFEADASLTAYFAQQQVNDQGKPVETGGTDSIAENKLFTISGMISNFKDSAGNRIAEGWEVKLGTIDFEDEDGSFTGGDTTNGNWEGQFYGAAGAAPTAIGGTFDDHFPNGHVAGAFGATKQKK